MDWDKLKTFYAVATLGSVSAASEKIHLSQSALSRQIASLEYQLDTKLFIRHAKGLKLTRQGEILFQSAQQMLASAENAATLIRNERNEPEGLLRIAVISGFSSNYLNPLILKFLQEYPKIRFSIKIIDSVIDQSLSDIDLLIYPKLSTPSKIVQKKLMTIHMRLFASQEYLNEHGTPQKISDLDNHRLIAYGLHKDHPFQNSNWHLTIGKEMGEVRESYLDVNSGTERVYFASHGVGIASLPMENPSVQSANLVQVLPEIEGTQTDYFLYYKGSSADIKKITLFKDFLIDFFSQ
jgi:DNA-binding transcriptional LysR family regulator